MFSSHHFLPFLPFLFSHLFLCRVGESRAYWSLSNAHTSLGDYKQARIFSAKYLKVAAEIGDSNAVDIARRNLADLDNVLLLQDK